eukprot:3827093-Rhodomonas_salina.1
MLVQCIRGWPRKSIDFGLMRLITSRWSVESEAQLSKSFGSSTWYEHTLRQYCASNNHTSRSYRASRSACVGRSQQTPRNQTHSWYILNWKGGIIYLISGGRGSEVQGLKLFELTQNVPGSSIPVFSTGRSTYCVPRQYREQPTLRQYRTWLRRGVGVYPSIAAASSSMPPSERMRAGSTIR